VSVNSSTSKSVAILAVPCNNSLEANSLLKSLVNTLLSSPALLITNSSVSSIVVVLAFKLIDLKVCALVGVNVAQVQPIAVQAVTSASVGNSTLPATHSSAFGIAVQVALTPQNQP